MLTTTPEFDTAIAADARKITARITINYTDAFLDTTIEADSIGTDMLLEDASLIMITEDSQAMKTEGNNRISYNDQMVNGRQETTHKWFSLEADGNILDGSYHLMPGTEAEANFNEVGWWGDNISDVSDIIPGDQGAVITFSARRVTSFEVTGDDQRNEFPVDFTVEFYAGASLEGTETIVANTLTTYSQDITPLSLITSVELHMTKWSDPSKVPKIIEFVTSVFETYTADVIENFTVTEQREISNNNSVPTGNIASNEADLSLMNFDRRFDANNTASPLFGIVKPNNKVDIEIGVLTSSGAFEFVPVFTGWTGGWNVPENAITASVRARDFLEILRKTKIITSEVTAGDTFEEWFTTVFSDAGLANTQYNIDSVLGGSIYVIPFGWFNNISHRDALQILAESCSAAVFVDRSGLIQVQSVDYFEVNDLDSLLTYDRSEYMDKSNQPIYENIVNKINVTSSPLAKTTSVTVYQTTSADKETAPANSVADYTITYRNKPVSDGVPTVDPVVSGVTVTDSDLFAWGGTVEVTNTNSSPTEFQIKIVGSTYAVAGQKTVTALDQDSIDDNGEFSFNFKENDFLQNKNLAGKIANTLLKSFKDPERDLTVTFSPGGNPALENDDRISVVDLYSTKEYNLISQQINYDGGLNMIQKGRVTQTTIMLAEDDQNMITEDDLFMVLE